MEKLIIVDTLNLLFRSYYALRGLTNASHHPTGMIFGLVNFFATLKKENKYDYVIFALDSPGGSFRKDLLPDYKANRKEPDEEILIQIPICIELIKKAGFFTLEKPLYEADDIIASITKNAKEQDIHTTIYSTDKDLYQLIEADKAILLGKDNEIINEDACYKKFGVYPKKMLDYLAIVGDSADNFKGIPGIGPKGALKLLETFKSIEDIYNNLNLVSNENTKKKLITYKEDAFLSLKLARLVDDLDFGDYLEKAKMPKNNFFKNIAEDIKKYNLNRFNALVEEDEPTFKPHFEKPKLKASLDITSLMSSLKSLKGRVVGFDIETTGLEHDACIVGFSVSDGNNSYYIPVNHKNAKNVSKTEASRIIKTLFRYSKIIGHNLKFDFIRLKNNYNLDFPENYTDTMVLAWLVNPDDKLSLDYLAKKYLDYNCINYEDIVKKDENFSDVDIDIACEYAAQDAYISLSLSRILNNNYHFNPLIVQQEMEFVKVLSDMENNGVRLKYSKLIELKEILEQDIEELQKKIYSFSKEDFNINSPKQLKEVLYNELKLPNINKDSTNEATLKQLDHPIIQYILEYRTANKVLSTYVMPLIYYNVCYDEIFIVKSHFMQTGTATGRLSSTHPNLQNIPTRSKYAKILKEAFVSKEGCSLVSLDYSQIELRMLAHFSEDENLIKAFKNDEDIHSKTALELFGSSDKEKRDIAKSINFGLIYGMGARRLSLELKIDYKEADHYIKKYFQAFPKIKKYFENTKELAKHGGFVETLLKRKRFFNYTKDVKTNNAHDRECVNSVLQGSAADLIKTAMIKIYPMLDSRARLVLQIHDELIFEVEDEYIEEFTTQVRKIMEEAQQLKVKIKTSLSIGKSWAKLK